MLWQTENISTQGFKLPLFLSYFLLIIAQFHLGFLKPDSTVREPESLLHFYFLYTYGLMHVAVLRQLWTGKWHLIQTTAPAHSLNMGQ